MSKRKPIEDILADAIRAAVPGVRLYREYAFTKHRRWRFDVAIPRLKLAIEVEGRAHCAVGQHRKDSEKFNAATAAGWRILRFPAAAVLAKSRLPKVVAQIARMITGVEDYHADSFVLTG